MRENDQLIFTINNSKKLGVVSENDIQIPTLRSKEYKRVKGRKSTRNVSAKTKDAGSYNKNNNKTKIHTTITTTKNSQQSWVGDRETNLGKQNPN